MEEGAGDTVGLAVGAVEVGRKLGTFDKVGRRVGTDEILGRAVGLLDFEGENVGDIVGALPHPEDDPHGIQTSRKLLKILPAARLLDLKPLIHLHKGWNTFISFAIASACGSSQMICN